MRKLNINEHEICINTFSFCLQYIIASVNHNTYILYILQ